MKNIRQISDEATEAINELLEPHLNEKQAEQVREIVEKAVVRGLLEGQHRAVIGPGWRAGESGSSAAGTSIIANALWDCPLMDSARRKATNEKTQGHCRQVVLAVTINTRD